LSVELWPDVKRLRHERKHDLMRTVEALARRLADDPAMLAVFDAYLRAGIERVVEDANDDAERGARTAYHKVLEAADRFASVRETERRADDLDNQAKALRAAANAMRDEARTQGVRIFEDAWATLTKEDR
jgi:hypothetical protein